LEKNRFLARRQLQERLDVHYNGEESLVAQYKREKSERKEARRSETNRILDKKRAFKSDRAGYSTNGNDTLSDKPIE
jgi:hypothetical protein